MRTSVPFFSSLRSLDGFEGRGVSTPLRILKTFRCSLPSSFCTRTLLVQPPPFLFAVPFQPPFPPSPHRAGSVLDRVPFPLWPPPPTPAVVVYSPLSFLSFARPVPLNRFCVRTCSKPAPVPFSSPADDFFLPSDRLPLNTFLTAPKSFFESSLVPSRFAYFPHF